MPARDICHDAVKAALEKDGWSITDDPLRFTIGIRSVYVDLGAERLLAAERGGQKIAVEIKSFLSNSPVSDLEDALGQYILYQDVLEEVEPQRVLHPAIREETYSDIFSDEIGRLLLNKKRFKLIVFNSENKEIRQWIA